MSRLFVLKTEHTGPIQCSHCPADLGVRVEDVLEISGLVVLKDGRTFKVRTTPTFVCLREEFVDSLPCGER